MYVGIRRTMVMWTCLFLPNLTPGCLPIVGWLVGHTHIRRLIHPTQSTLEIYLSTPSQFTSIPFSSYWAFNNLEYVRRLSRVLGTGPSGYTSCLSSFISTSLQNIYDPFLLWPCQSTICMLYCSDVTGYPWEDYRIYARSLCTWVISQLRSV